MEVDPSPSPSSSRPPPPPLGATPSYFDPESSGRREEYRRYSSSLPGGDVPPGGEFVQAAALVSQLALYSKELLEQRAADPAMMHPSEAVAKGPRWADLFEPRVKHALFVGIGIQILQQFAGINGVLYYTPQILEQAGVGVLLSNVGLITSSVSILISALTTLLMLPSIGIAMRLMDMSGRSAVQSSDSKGVTLPALLFFPPRTTI